MKKKLKILFVTPYYPPAYGYGGPPSINQALAVFLTNRGHQVTVATTDACDATRRVEKLSEILKNVRVLRFKNISNWLAWNFKIFLPLGFATYLKLHLKEFDFVYLSDFRSYQNMVTYRQCLKYKIPYSISAYGSLPRSGGLKRIFKTIFDFFFSKRMLTSAQYLFAQTRHEIQQYIKFGGLKSRCKLLPLGIESSVYINQKKDNSFRQELGLKQEDRVILFLGRINYLKGIDFLIKALPDIQKNVPLAKLVIVGRDDGYLKTVKKLIKKLKLAKSVVVYGPLYNEESYKAYLSADVFALTPRHHEETSLACLTALALGIPVITTKQASIPFLEDYQAGYEINLKHSEIVEKLTILLRDPILSSKMGLNGKKLVEEVFDISKIGKALEKFILRAVK